MDRDHALAAARTIAARDQLGPPGYREAASFALDEETQTFVELEGGGKEAFTQMLRNGLYSAYTWRVRHFAEGQPNETTIQFTPDGQPYAFVERLDEMAPGAALSGAAAARGSARRRRASAGRPISPHIALVEQGQERRPGGRVDHTFTYERPTPTLNEGRYRLQLVVSGDRLTSVRHFVKIPEAFSRRYENMRSANEAIGVGSAVGMVLLYVFGGIGVGLFFMLRRRMVVWRPAVVWGVAVALPAGARVDQRVAADLDVLRHGGAADHVLPPAGRDDRGDVPRLLGVLRAVVHGRRDAGRAAFGTHPADVAGVGPRPRQFHRRPRPHGLGLPAGLGLLRLRRPALSDHHTRVRLVVAGGSAAPPGRARDVCAVAVGDRQLVPGGLLGGVPVPGRTARRRRADRRPLRQAAAVPRDRLRRPGPGLRRGPRAVSQPALVRPSRRTDSAVDRIRPALPVLRPDPRHRAPFHVRRGLVRTAGLHHRRAGHPVPAVHDRRADAGAAVGRPVAPLPGRRLDDAGTGGSECRMGPAAGAARTCNGRRSAENRRTQPRCCAAPGSAQEEWRCSSCWR